jgi:hypothetical protein|tara:strand:- start:72 stop:320 length:249 start_codon:yes stop_codon:yes gene_type:complete
MEYKILEQEAYVVTFTLNADFEYQGKKYSATGIYYNGDSIVDIEVFNEEDESCIDNEILEEKLFEIAKEILENMDIDKHFSY